ncbi:hypothetical protein [Streptomyces sp. B5E4]|uniref:hypothetical protein n=1 Tax=Streptomyces sp. B5E4 TaxID=3153568 RepID=UPI00325EEF10
MTSAFFSGRREVEEALVVLPPTSDPAFLQEIRRVIDRTRNPERVFRRICEDSSKPASMRFCALYAVLLRLRGTDEIELARIGDPTCLAFGGREIELSTTFFGRREAQAIERANGADLSDLNSRDGIRERRRKYIKGIFPESVFSGHPEAVLHIQAESIRKDSARHIILCTDGFARAVMDYGIYSDWPTLLEAALESGLKSILNKIRMYEAGGMNAVHFKRSDDVTALLVEV